MPEMWANEGMNTWMDECGIVKKGTVSFTYLLNSCESIFIILLKFFSYIWYNKCIDVQREKAGHDSVIDPGKGRLKIVDQGICC